MWYCWGTGKPETQKGTNEMAAPKLNEIRAANKMKAEILELLRVNLLAVQREQVGALKARDHAFLSGRANALLTLKNGIENLYGSEIL